MTAAAILQAILWMAPHVAQDDANWYSRAIVAATEEWNIDPVEVLSIISKESNYDSAAVSKWNDRGLMQIHVSKTTHTEYIGREHELFDPLLNIWLGIKLLRYWKDYHWRNCRGGHLYVSHYKFGNHVPVSWRAKSYLTRYYALLHFLRQSATTRRKTSKFVPCSSILFCEVRKRGQVEWL